MKIQPDVLKWPMSFSIVGVMAIVSLVLAQDAHRGDSLPGNAGATIPAYATVVSPNQITSLNAQQSTLQRSTP